MAVVFLHPRRMARTYRADTVTALYRAALEADALPSGRLDVVLDEPGTEGARLGEMTAWLAARKGRLAVVEHGFSAPFLDAVRAGGVTRVLAVGRPSEIARPGIDAAAETVGCDTFVRLARALLDDVRVPELPGVWRKRQGEVVPPTERERFDARHELAHRRPLWSGEERLGGPAHEPWLSRGLLADLGCPYRNRPCASPLLQGLALPVDVPAGGCAFCERPPAGRLPTSLRVDLLVQQARHLAKERPEVTRLQVLDELFVAYADRFARALLEADLPPRDVLVAARPDWLLTHFDRVERAAALLHGRHRLVLFSVGIESFSDPELARFGKGFDAKTNVAVLERLDLGLARSPALAVEPAFGFILFTPWSSLGDLARNARGLRATRFSRFREGVVHSRLRLYPEIPLFHRARAERLLTSVERTTGPDFGYGDAEWRFRDPRAAAVYQAVQHERLGGDDVEAFARVVARAAHDR
jgi:hypothetical protein